ncbi:MAG: methionine synthase [Ignavibacteriales bacterium]|nr:methionine synthase [Ignavibacteriales bacterium]
MRGVADMEASGREAVFGAKEFRYELADLNLTRDDVVEEMGYTCEEGNERGYLCDLAEEAAELAKSNVELRGGFVVVEPDRIDIQKGSIQIDDVVFDSQPIITARLRRAEGLALFAATAGDGLEKISKELMSGDDMLKGYVIDAYASAAVEAVADKLEAELERIVEPRGWNVTNRYSPGYCNWSVAEQSKLFSFLPEAFLGITLTATSLMRPIKSVSGVIGVGENVKRQDYQCAVCDMRNCYRRRVVQSKEK